MKKAPKSRDEMDLITAVVRHSRADAVLKAALDAGATGITYSWARGTGVRQNLGYAGTLIESEKQMLWVVTPKQDTEKILLAIVDAGNLSLPGEGFAYVHPISRAVGFMPQE